MAEDQAEGAKWSKLSEINRLTIPGRRAIEVGDAKQAVSLMSRKHELILEVFGPDSSSTGTSLIDLSAAYHIAGREREARAKIEEAYSIYQRVDRHDGQLDRLELTMMDVCTMQGHSFEVERIAKARIARLSGEGVDRDQERAAAQDDLAQLYIQQRRNDEAIPLLTDSLSVFDRAGAEGAKDASICCLYLSRVFRIRPDFADANNLERAESYGRRALELSKSSDGPDSAAAAIIGDELSVAIAYSAQEEKSPQKAAEAVALSDWALTRFRALFGENGKETLRSRENNAQLHSMVSGLLGKADQIAKKVDNVLALPTTIFVSHSYADGDALTALKAVFPDYVKPIIFEPINVPPTEYVSEKLISGVLGADGFIFIDSEVSRASFWTAFERDLAERKDKQVFRFDSETREIVRDKREPRQLMLAHLYHPSDVDDVNKVMRWLIDLRSFQAFDDPGRAGDRIQPLGQQDPQRRDMLLFSVRTFGAIYLMFLSDAMLEDANLRAHAMEQVYRHPKSTLVCWLDRPRRVWPWDPLRRLTRAHKNRSFMFTKRPTDPEFRLHELDDLMVRLYWLLHQGRPGDWFR